jgi:predicted enzyme related to lactoylglutathione lyase
MNLNSILIGSQDPKQLAEYYTKLFGEPSMADEHYAGWQIGTGFLSVGPHSEITGKNAQPGRVIWNIESADVKADFERLKAAGATVVREPYEPEGMPEDAPEMSIATFSDPDDNYFQLMSAMEGI